MAYKTTKIKAGMTLPKLAQQYGVEPAAILKANKIPKLSAGMVVRIPPKPMQPGMDLQNPYNQFTAPVQSSFISGSGQINYNTQSNPIRSQGPLVNSGFQSVIPQAQTSLPTGSFVSGNGSVNLQGQIVGGRGSVPTTADRISAVVQQQSTTPLVPVRPQGVYTGDPANNPNDAAWANYWNYQAANPGPKAPPKVMTKDQIWNMKAQARRRKREREEEDNNYNARQPPVKYQPFLNIGNATNENITWRV